MKEVISHSPLPCPPDHNNYHHIAAVVAPAAGAIILMLSMLREFGFVAKGLFIWLCVKPSFRGFRMVLGAE